MNMRDWVFKSITAFLASAAVLLQAAVAHPGTEQLSSPPTPLTARSNGTPDASASTCIYDILTEPESVGLIITLHKRGGWALESVTDVMKTLSEYCASQLPSKLDQIYFPISEDDSWQIALYLAGPPQERLKTVRDAMLCAKGTNPDPVYPTCRPRREDERRESRHVAFPGE